MNRTTSWLQFRSAKGTSRLRLFCFPHAGGGATAYRSWLAELPPFVELCPVLLPGRETRLSESPYLQFDSLVEDLDRELRPWIDIPYAIFGHSMGALLAFEWARRLKRYASSQPVWLFVSGRRAPDLPGDSALLHPLPDREFINELTRVYNGIPQELLQSDELMEVLLPILRADIAVVESYRFLEDEPLNCPITVFSGIEDSSVSWDQLIAWKRHTKRRFAMHVFPGGHFFPHGPMLQSVSANLEEWDHLH